MLTERTELEQAVITALEDQFTDAMEDLEADSSSTTPEYCTIWGILERMGIGEDYDEADTRVEVYEALRELNKRGEVKLLGADDCGHSYYAYCGDAA